MATGAGDGFWSGEKLPGVFKHAVVRRYLPVFGGKTGSSTGSVFFLDGYAGRGRLDDGTAGSAELIMRSARDQLNRGITWHCYLFERDITSYSALEAVAGEYVAQGVQVVLSNGAVEDGLDAVIEAAARRPLFLFMDPCGLGIDYERLVAVANRDRMRYLPTEILLNFSMDAVRRIGGHVTSEKRNDATIARLDRAVGGSWWHEYFCDGDTQADKVVDGFVDRLRKDTGMRVFRVPVRRKPDRKPVYYLVFATRSNYGIWAFSDAVAKAAQDWRNQIAERDSEGALFPSAPSTTLDELDSEALPHVKDQILSLLVRFEGFVVRDHPEILGDYFGQARTTVVRRAIKSLHTEGRTSSTGVGRSIEGLEVRRPD